jgi:hypothetical protein
MKTRAEKQKLWLFFVGLLIAALVINSQFSHKFSHSSSARLESRPEPAIRPQQDSQREPRPEALSQTSLSPAQAETESRDAIARKASKDAADEKANLKARYLNAGFTRQQGIKTIAVAVASEDKKLNHTIGNALADHFNTNTIAARTSVFRPEFVSDGRVGEAIDGSGQPLGNLDAPQNVDALLFARQDVQYSTNSSLQNVISAHMQIEIAFLSLASDTENQRWTLTADGAGFTQKDARLQAEERLIKQIANSTNMVLSPEFRNNQ